MPRRAPNRTRLDPYARRGLQIAFWIIFALALGVGGPAALAGLPVLVEAMTPSGNPFPGVAVRDVVHRGILPPRTAAAPSDIAPPLPAKSKAPAIAIVIDDMGADLIQNRRAIALPKNVSLSFLPSPADTPRLAEEAHRAGHEILVHVPMESPKHDPSMTLALRRDLPEAENLRRLHWALSRVPFYAGINNHEGSLFTADRQALMGVAQALSGRGVYFLDSRTTAATEVVSVARAFAVPSAGRDVFLDDDPSPAAIDGQLAALEKRARKQGIAIAIGHPRPATLDALERWCGAHRQFRLVPASAAIRLKTEWEMGVTVARRE